MNKGRLWQIAIVTTHCLLERQMIIRRLVVPADGGRLVDYAGQLDDQRSNESKAAEDSRKFGRFLPLEIAVCAS